MMITHAKLPESSLCSKCDNRTLELNVQDRYEYFKCKFEHQLIMKRKSVLYFVYECVDYVGELYNTRRSIEKEVK